ncbi:MAG TPA: tetratricopeptide repeat protein [Kofleriaceae bacterium]
MRKIRLAVLLIPVIPALAWAQPKTAADWFKEGEKQYSLQNFDKAVEAFKEAFALETNESNKAIYLFNVAQAYRQANDCRDAYFYYKRFLALKENDTVKPIPAKTRKEVEDRISELEVCAQQAASISRKPPNSNLPPDGDGGDKGQSSGTDTGHKEPRKEVATGAPGTVPASGSGGSGGPGGDDDDSGSITKPGATGAPHLISVRFTGGGTTVSAGNIPVPVQATFALTAGYPIPINDKLTVEAGAALTFTPVPFDASQGTQSESKTAQLWGVMANGAVSYEVIPKLAVRADLGLGALFFASIDQSPFTGGQMTTGALSMFHLRAAASADYAITPNLVLTATPIAFTYSPPHDGLVSEIKSITSIDFMVGFGYRK